MFKILKIILIILFGTVCLLLASDFAQKYAAEASEKEQTLAEAVMKSQLEARIKKAEEQAQKELEEQGQTIVTEVMETKPPVTGPVTTVSETEETTELTTVTTATESETTVTETETAADTIPVTETSAEEEEIITEFTRGGLLPEDRSNIPVRSLFALTEEEKDKLVDYLIEHYFLDGYKYSEEETRPELKEKKRLAAEMESGVIETVNMIFGNMNTGDVSVLLSADYKQMKKDVEEIRDEFREKYADAASYGDSYAALYEDSLKYFDRLIQAFDNLQETSEKYKEATNPLLALGLLTSSLEDVIIPEIMGVLERSFDLVEVSQEIFLEGTQGTQLLTRDEVRDIIINPGLIL